uniref:Uncharacterized protein n=1 Tax=Opuntia streptacantha TaxID=393608 RepID=A0A7C9AN29_OPUST
MFLFLMMLLEIVSIGQSTLTPHGSIMLLLRPLPHLLITLMPTIPPCTTLHWTPHSPDQLLLQCAKLPCSLSIIKLITIIMIHWTAVILHELLTGQLEASGPDPSLDPNQGLHAPHCHLSLLSHIVAPH